MIRKLWLKMQKWPWGIVAGVLAMIASFVLVAIIAFYVADVMTAELNKTSFTIFDTWYQTLLFVVLLFVVLGFGFSIYMFVRRCLEEKKAPAPANGAPEPAASGAEPRAAAAAESSDGTKKESKQK